MMKNISLFLTVTLAFVLLAHVGRASANSTGSAGIPLSSSLIGQAFEADLHRLSLSWRPDKMVYYVSERVGSRPQSANAMKYLTILAGYDPDYLGPDGQTTAAERALMHFRALLEGGTEPGYGGVGLNAQGYLPVLQAFLYAKQHVPAIWNELTAAEKSKIDLMMEATLISTHFSYSDTNDNRLSLDGATDFKKTWNPNHRAGLLGAPLVYYYFDQNAALLNAMLKNFDYDDFMQRLDDADFTNMKTVFTNTPRQQLIDSTVNDGLDGFTYEGHPLDEPGQWVKSYSDFMFNAGPVRPYGGDSHSRPSVSADFPYGYWGYLNDGYDEFPNLGAEGMANELDSSDAGGARSSLHYVQMGWTPLLEGYFALLTNEAFSPDGSIGGLSAQAYHESMLKMNVGTIDYLYKNAHGYNSYDNGKKSGLEHFETLEVALNADLWHQVINNPVEMLDDGVNAALTASEMRSALEQDRLGLVLFAYNALPAADKDEVASELLALRGSGFTSKQAFQTALSARVWQKALEILNEAATSSAVQSALQSDALGLYIAPYDALNTDDRAELASRLLENRPVGGYADRSALRLEVLRLANLYASSAWLAVNAAQTAADMLEAITASSLGLVLEDWYALPPAYRTVAAQALIDGRPYTGYTGVIALQAALQTAISTMGAAPYLAAVNLAQNVAELEAALSNAGLGADLSEYRSYGQHIRLSVLTTLLGERPVGGYPDLPAIQAVIAAALHAATTSQTTVVVSEDSFIDGTGDNRGDHAYVVVKSAQNNARYGYLKFDLSHLSGAELAGIQTVTLDLVANGFGTGQSPGAVAVYGVADTAWTESGILSSNAPFIPSVTDATYLDLQTISNVGQYYSLDVTTFVRSRIAAGEKAFTLVISGYNNEGKQINFRSRNHPAQTPPRLTLAKAGEVRFQAVEDTFIDGASDPRGSHQYVVVKSAKTNARYGYLKFDLSGLSVSEAMRVSSVSLEVYANSFGTGQTSGLAVVYGIADNAWSESTLVTSNAPFIPDAKDTTYLDLLNITAAGQYYAFQVGEFIRNGLHDGKRVFTLVVAGYDNEGKQINFRSQNHGANTPPRLSVVVEPPAPDSMPSPVQAELANNGIAVWSSVDNAAYYLLQLYKNGSTVSGRVYTDQTGYALTDLLRRYGTGEYTLGVVAVPNDLTQYSLSEEKLAAGSATIRGIRSGSSLPKMTLPVHTSEEEAGLPGTVTYSVSNGTNTLAMEFEVSWSGYDASVPGIVRLHGELTLPDTILTLPGFVEPVLEIEFIAQ